MYWPKLTNREIEARIFSALHKNTNYRESQILGIPASYLDPEIFYGDAPFLQHAPYLSTLIANPNHIGCHTLNQGESIFNGTQEIEKEVIQLCAEQIFGGEKDAQDGYVAPGGTEANIQAAWVYRNYFMQEFNATPEEISIIYSCDSHYSLAKASNLLGIHSLVIKTDSQTREICLADLETKIRDAASKKVNYFIVVLNLSTTMFGSVDNIDAITTLLARLKVNYKLHVDAAFGGFIYPFTCPESSYSFKNKCISSFTLDAHKLLQAPYGTGIFIIRKNFLRYVETQEARYVKGADHTLCGSRSGANAIAVWMVMHSYGSEGWKEKMRSLMSITSDVCDRLDEMGLQYFRDPYINIIAIRASDIPPKVAEKYRLVADDWENKPTWWKVVVMPHITRGIIDSFLNDLASSIKLTK